jgi:hypothetical protein
MQYLVSVIDDTAGLATPDETAAINAFNDRLQAEGHWVFAGGLASPSTATVIDNRGEEAIFTDGPFLESKEYLAGFWIIEAADLDVALRTGRQHRRDRLPDTPPRPAGGSTRRNRAQKRRPTPMEPRSGHRAAPRPQVQRPSCTQVCLQIRPRQCPGEPMVPDQCTTARHIGIGKTELKPQPRSIPV